jgi:hypothetical protein
MSQQLRIAGFWQGLPSLRWSKIPISRRYFGQHFFIGGTIQIKLDLFTYSKRNVFSLERKMIGMIPSMISLEVNVLAVLFEIKIQCT